MDEHCSILPETAAQAYLTPIRSGIDSMSLTLGPFYYGKRSLTIAFSVRAAAAKAREPSQTYIFLKQALSLCFSKIFRLPTPLPCSKDLSAWILLK
jgi:hypothetical protein